MHWNFLLNILTALNFPGVFINWIITFVTSPRYSIVINGGLEGYFRGEKGIREGDPLSPYLFVIVMNVLSSFLDLAAENEICSRWGFNWFWRNFLNYLGWSSMLARVNCFDSLFRRMKLKVGLLDTCLMRVARLQLVQTVLYSLQVYWSKHFLISSGIIKKIE